jgi:hypothetical protein
VSGLVSSEYGEETLALTPSAENGWRGGGAAEAWGEREKKQDDKRGGDNWGEDHHYRAKI